MSDITIYHNPRCSKSREAMKLVAEVDATVHVVEYLKTPPTVDELDRICTQLQLTPVQLVRTGEKRFQELGLSVDDDRSRQEWLELLAENPILIERPIVIKGDRAEVGRPVQRVVDLLKD